MHHRAPLSRFYPRVSNKNDRLILCRFHQTRENTETTDRYLSPLLVASLPLVPMLVAMPVSLPMQRRPRPHNVNKRLHYLLPPRSPIYTDQCHEPRCQLQPTTRPCTPPARASSPTEKQTMPPLLEKPPCSHPLTQKRSELFLQELCGNNECAATAEQAGHQPCHLACRA